MEGINQRSRSVAAAEEDGAADQIGYESPRSGIATPQPDLQDRRLPGIMSYFNQVRASSFPRLFSGSFRTSGQAATTQKASDHQTDEAREPDTPPEVPLSPAGPGPEPEPEPEPCTDASDEGPPLLAHEILGPPSESLPQEGSRLHPYPTPPVSQPSSLRNYAGDRGSVKSRSGTPPLFRRPSVSDAGKGKARRMSMLAPLTTTTVNGSVVTAPHLSNPAGRASTVPNSPSRPTSHDRISYESASVLHLKKLTSVSGKKSGANTPTRALSSTQHSRSSDGHDSNSRHNGESIDRTATNTPTPQGARVPAPRGKLAVKISEARGLKRCQNPYVVVVFQRSELISAGPRPSEMDDDAAIAAVAMGGVPIQRTGSDSGRPMAIPMRSRQSSNTSLSDFNTFRNRTSGSRRSLTNPKWDAEAIL